MIESRRFCSDVGYGREIAGCEFRDARLGKRFRTLLERIGSDIGQSIPFVCQDWANTKAAYRFLANHRVSEAGILSGHFQSTRERIWRRTILFWCLRKLPSSPLNGTDRL